MKFFIAIRLAFIFLAGFTNLYAQGNEKSLIAKIEQAPGDSARIKALGKLANYYFENDERPRGDSVLGRQLQIAEASRNQNLMLWVLFKNPVNRFYDLNNSRQDKSRLQYALEYAKNNELNDYVSLAYCRISAYELAEGNMDKGLSIANLAITTSFASSNDSVKALCGLQLGYAYLLQGNALMAFKAFNNAYDLAVKKYNRLLVAEVYRAIAAMYKTLGQPGIAIDYIFRSMDIFENAGLRDEVAADYIALGKLYSYGVAKEYLLKAEKLADSLNNKSLKLEAQNILFSYMMTKEKPSLVLQFLQQHKELVKLYDRKGPYYTDWMYGEVYLYGRMPDSARYYFEKAAPFFDSVSSINQQKDFYDELANSYYESKAADIDKAIFYKEKSLQLSKQVSGLREIKTISYHLSDLYERKGDLVKALFYNRQYDLYKDSLALLSKDKDLALLEIGNETKRKQEAAQLLQEKRDRLHNLQYMVITISVLTAFVLLLFLGLFKLSKLTIQVLGFLSFISFFEFIIMLLDTYIHHITHGEPLKVWLIKIGLLSMLLPLHHYLEEKVIHYLLSKKLIEAKSFFYLRKVFTRYKKTSAVAAPAGENIPVPEKNILGS
ncbi:MAG: tetratricopeptide repeat protein [Ferruginibacter sp.]|nr:tetratricopeptide repeat protein [Ferruginibacter sp.]